MQCLMNKDFIQQGRGEEGGDSARPGGGSGAVLEEQIGRESAQDGLRRKKHVGASDLRSTVVEDFKVYELEDIHFSPDPKITNLNEEIKKRVNSYGQFRVQYLESIAVGGPVIDQEIALRNMKNLKKLIVKLQEDINSRGGIYFQIPSRFGDVPNIN